jgi:hypothetical protein
MKTTTTLGLGAAVAIGAGLGCAALIGLSPADPHSCLNTADQAALGQHAADLLVDVVGCTFSGSDPSAARACIQAEAGVSPQCADCAVAIGACTSANCGIQCANGAQDDGCKLCIATHCNDSLIVCAGMPVYACKNTSDGTALMTHTNLEMDLRNCAALHVIDPVNVVGCIQQTDGLSEACATCYAEEGSCALAQCTKMCTDQPDGGPCMDCVTQKCGAVFALCTGLPPDDGGPG